MTNRFLHTFLLSVRTGDIASEFIRELFASSDLLSGRREVHVSGINARSCTGFKGARHIKKNAPLEAQGYGDRDEVWHSDLYAQRFSVCDFRGGVGNDSRTYLDQSNL